MKISISDRLFLSICYFLLLIAGLSCLLPLMHVISLSISDAHAVLSGKVTLWPVDLSLQSFRLLLEGTQVVRAFWNSVVITVVGVVLSMIVTILTAYPLSRSYFIARRFWSLAIVFTMLFNGGLIPTYLVVKSLGLVNTYGALWVMSLVITFNLMILLTSFRNIPEELIEAGVVDGASEWKILISIILPLSVPVLVTLVLFYMVHYWNLFFHTLIYIHDPLKYNLSVMVQQLVQSQQVLMDSVNNLAAEDLLSITPEGLKAASVVVLVIPMLVVYPFMQKYFMKGIMIGAIKG